MSTFGRSLIWEFPFWRSALTTIADVRSPHKGFPTSYFPYAPILRGHSRMVGRLPRKLAAILYTDVAGFSRLTGEDQFAVGCGLSV